MIYRVVIVFFSLSCFLSCGNEKDEVPFKDIENNRFTSIPESHSNISFENNVVENLHFNFMNYTYIYNGGGVAVGDINNDGLEDVYFTSNQNSNKLYLNKGNFVFEDITENALVNDEKGWSTGVTMVDINNDGWLDIYVCKSGSLKKDVERRNKLFVNQKDNTFKEESAKYRLNLSDYSVQSYFFDYDKDGDLDMYLVNHREDFNNNNSITSQTERQLTLKGSDLLLRNDNGRFFDITRKAGVVSKAWGLSASIGDFNGDSWLDIYVANDFWEPDFLYINNKNGTFSDEILTRFKHISTNSMGSDYADINNDLLPDLVVLDMMAADRKRGKENMATMSTSDFNFMVNEGYHHQYMSNMLQVNNYEGMFSEIGQLSGIAKTDWSWAPLIADFDNDGFNDVFVTNGIENDLSNQDFRNKMRQNIAKMKKVSLEEAIDMMPSTKLANYMFMNNGDYSFSDQSEDLGFGKKVNSNGAVYADLDNDGDLDLVINNQSDKASIYRNNADGENNYLSVLLVGSKENIKGIGAKVEVYTKETQQLKEVSPSRGYQSSVSYRLNFGLGVSKRVDSLKVTWVDGKTQTLRNVDVNRKLELTHKQADSKEEVLKVKAKLFESVSPSRLGINYKHHKVEFNDYDLQLLLPQKQSTVDSPLVVGDVNNDGLDDFFVGNTTGFSAELYIQNQKGEFIQSSKAVFEKDKKFCDNNAKFFDADGDGDLDLYVATGNYSQKESSKMLQDRLYINDGKGNFSRGNLPKMHTVTKAITVADFDSDGDLDLFIGGRVIPGKYPNAPESYLLENRNGKYANVTATKSKGLKNIGLVNDVIFSDFDNDGDDDLIVVGEWLPMIVFRNDKGSFSKLDLPSDNLIGWYQTIKAVDYDLDGDEDYFIGNFGVNNKFHPTIEKPLHIYANYFDDNKSYDIALSKEYNGALFPVRGKECSSEQTPFLKEKIGSYSEFANSNIIDVYGKENIEEAVHLKAATFKSYYVRNKGDGKFEFEELPNRAQFGPTLDFEFIDVNKGRSLDVLGVGSIYDSEVETIRYDASKGYLLANNQGYWECSNDVILSKEVKATETINIGGKTHVLVLVSNEPLSLLKLRP